MMFMCERFPLLFVALHSFISLRCCYVFFLSFLPSLSSCFFFEHTLIHTYIHTFYARKVEQYPPQDHKYHSNSASENMSLSVSPTANGNGEDINEAIPTNAPAMGENSADDASPRPREEKQQHQDESTVQDDVKGLETPIHSAMKGKSGRARSTDMKPRFNPEVSVIETPSYFLVMNNEESGDEAEELAVFNRLYEEAKSRLERSKAAATAGNDGEVEDPDSKECTFSPVVSDYAKQLGRYSKFEEFLQSQEERRKVSAMHFAKKKEKVLDEDRVPLFEDMPRKHSLRIISYLEKERNYKGPIKGWRERFRAYMKKLHEQDRDLTPNKSKTNASAPSVHSGIIRDDAVFDRLYDEAFVRAMSQRVVAMTQLERESRELYRPKTNESEYKGSEGHSSQISPSKGRSNSRCSSSSQRLSSRGGHLASLNSDSMSSVFEELYAMGEEYRRRREIRAMEAIENQEEFTFKPATNPESSKIIMERAIARAKGELPERAVRKQRPDAADENDGNEANARERKRNLRFNPDIFCSRLQRKEFERLKRLAELRRQLRMNEASECTFRPSISRNSQAMAMQKGYGQIRFASSLHSSPRHSRHHTAGSEEGGHEYNDARNGDGDGNNTSQRDVHRYHQQRRQETAGRSNSKGDADDNVRRSSSGSSGSTGGGLNEPAGRLFDAEEVTENYISALSSEIQGVLSQWTEAAERAKATI
ncbi:hypothetical protein MOQ_003423 [Trypanosoma cruzi marinkellei]|uniref:Uncharacterized protein n=1 Tax=Trypanosoma cruzi marinkellei TaxID=85056 RepID=K2NUS4_TRYCR|nr:hypothetical protein MOQ_003423 [Trypanosoma cruzi marinkellei]